MTSASWGHETLFVSPLLIYNSKASNSTKVSLPNTPGCWRLPHICTPEGGWVRARRRGSRGKGRGSARSPIAQPWQLSLQFQGTQMQEGELGNAALASPLQQHPHQGTEAAAAVTVGPARSPCSCCSAHVSSPLLQQQAHEPNNPSYSRSIQLTSPSFQYPHHSSCLQPRDPRNGGSAHHPRVRSSDTSSSRAPATPEARNEPGTRQHLCQRQQRVQSASSQMELR